MISQELQDLFSKLAIAQTHTDTQLAKTDSQLAQLQAEVAETSRVVKEVGRRMGSMASNQGDVAEEFFYNSLVEQPKIGSVKFDFADFNQTRSKKGRQLQLDIRMVNGNSVALIEVKYKAHLSDLEQVEDHISKYRSFYPEHKDFDIYAGIAALSVPNDVVKAAKAKGYFVLQRKGEVFNSDTKAMRAF